MKLTVEKVTGKNARAVKSIYLEAFPKEERMPFWTMRLLDKLPATQLLAFYDGAVLCGFAYLGVEGDVVFLMFLAVDQTLRSRGYGSAILQVLRERYPRHRHVVSIEMCSQNAPNRDQRLRRKAFYLNNGYEETGWQITLSKVPQEVLAANGEFDPQELQRFFQKYSNQTMNPSLEPLP